MIEIKDLTGLGQPITKLIEVVSSGLGALYRPHGIRREGAAQADALRLVGKAQLEVELDRTREIALADNKNKALLVPQSEVIEERVQQRIQHRENQRQENLEAIASAAVTHMKPEVSDAPVDEDWTARFFGIAEDVASKNMQDLWGRVLAGEVAKPGSFSMRTLEVLRNLSQREAEAFQRIRHLSLDLGRVIKLSTTQKMSEFGLPLETILDLRDAGLVMDNDMLQIVVTIPPSQSFGVIGYAGKALLLEPKDVATKTLNLPVYHLTQVGKELLSLIDPVPNLQYLRRIAGEHTGINFYFGTAGMPKETFELLSPGT